jgi:hypothetical protein
VTLRTPELPDLDDIPRMTGEELQTTSKQLIAYIQRRLRPNTTRAVEIYDRWTQKKFWTIIEATIIGIGLDPDLLDGIQYMKSEDAVRFHQLLDLLRREFESDRVEPRDFVKFGKYHRSAIDVNLVAEIEKRLQRKTRPVDISRKETTLAKMLLAMACAKYNYKKREKSDNAVAESIQGDLDSLGSGMTLSKGAILNTLRQVLEENDSLRLAIERAND